jgi:hypothetical protein
MFGVRRSAFGVHVAPHLTASGAQEDGGTWTFEAPSRPLRQQQKARAAAPCARAAAFTLIETALALLAIGLGLMAIFGLGRIGLKSAKESSSDLRCESMADAVFETLREYNVRFIERSKTPKEWIICWGEFVAGDVVPGLDKIPFPPVANMSTSENLQLHANVADLAYFIQLTQGTPVDIGNASGTLQKAYDADNLSLTEWNPSYLLDIAPNNASISPVTGYPDSLLVRLVIYPDGDTPSSEPRMYYTTLTNTGGLP